MSTKEIDPVVSIGALALRTGVAVSALRFYEEQGLITSDRSRGGQRRFLKSDIRRVSFVLIAQQLGLPLARIKALMSSLPNARTPTKQDWQIISRAIRADIDERLALLTRARNGLDGCIGCGCLSLKSCQLYNPGDREGRRGKTGPRRMLKQPTP
jgi:MerR family transcriptional regulator, redox-sensitive transcriptional activator SoxR